MSVGSQINHGREEHPATYGTRHKRNSDNSSSTWFICREPACCMRSTDRQQAGSSPLNGPPLNSPPDLSLVSPSTATITNEQAIDGVAEWVLQHQLLKKQQQAPHNTWILAVDVDETLVDCTAAYYRIAQQWFQDNLGLDLSPYLSLTEFRHRGGTRSLFHISEIPLSFMQEEELKKYLTEHQYSDEFNCQLPPLPEAQTAMQWVGSQVALYLTARPQQVLTATVDSLSLHGFPVAPVVACPEEFMEDPYTWKALILMGLIQALMQNAEPVPRPQIVLVDDSYQQWLALQQILSQPNNAVLSSHLQMFLHAGVRTQMPPQEKRVQALSWPDIVAQLMCAR